MKLVDTWKDTLRQEALAEFRKMLLDFSDVYKIHWLPLTKKDPFYKQGEVELFSTEGKAHKYCLTFWASLRFHEPSLFFVDVIADYETARSKRLCANELSKMQKVLSKRFGTRIRTGFGSNNIKYGIVTRDTVNHAEPRIPENMGIRFSVVYDMMEKHGGERGQ